MGPAKIKIGDLLYETFERTFDEDEGPILMYSLRDPRIMNVDQGYIWPFPPTEEEFLEALTWLIRNNKTTQLQVEWDRQHSRLKN